MDSPTEQMHNATVVNTMRELVFSVFTSKCLDYEQHIYYIKFALQFADMQISELVTVFNAQVQRRAWTSMRAYHDQALMDEFQRRGVDTSSVCKGNSISFAQAIKYDMNSNKLIALI